MAIIWLFLVLTWSTVFYLVLARLMGSRIRVATRLGTVPVGAAGVAAPARGREPKVRRRRTVGWWVRLESVLRQAEIGLPVREFILRWGLVTLSTALLLWLAIGPLGMVVAVAVSALGTLLYLRALGQRRLRRFNEGLHDMLTIVYNSLRAGHSFAQALQVVGEDMGGPISEEVNRMQAEMQLGVAVEEALERANDRIGSDDFDLVVTAILIQRQIGGNLAEVLERITETIRERVRLKQEVKALTAQGRLSGAIFMLLPVGVGALLYVLNPAYISVLFTRQLGWAMLVLAVVGQAIGYVLIRRIVNVEL